MIGSEINAEVVNQGKKMSKQDDEAALEALKQAEFVFIDPAIRAEMEKVKSHLQLLRTGDLLKRVDSLVQLNEVISLSCGQG